MPHRPVVRLSFLDCIRDLSSLRLSANRPAFRFCEGGSSRGDVLELRRHALLILAGILLFLPSATAQTPVVPKFSGPTASSTTLTLSRTSTSTGIPITLTATVTGSAGTASGTVSFLNGTSLLGTGTLGNTGTAMLTTTFQTAGTYSLTAQYGGSTVYSASTSTAQTLTVTAAALTISPQTLHFGNIAVGSTSSAKTATITNAQTATVNISQIISELGANPSDFSQTNNCPAALAEQSSCQITITFTPDGVGPKSAGIAIIDDAVPSQQLVNVDGTGTGAILQVNPGNLKTIAGSGTAGNAGDGGPATAAQLNQPNGVAFDPAGNLYIADDNANVVRKVDTNGNITTFAGTGTQGYTGDGGPATSAQLSIPFSVTSDATGNIYIQDTGNYVIRKVNTQGIISTFAGTGQAGHSGDGGPATAAKFNQNQGARFDSAGNLFVPQCRGASIRKIDTAGNISTVAGNFTEGFSGDGGAATSAELQCPSGVAIDAAGNLYIADEFNYRIRKVDTSGVITTYAGTGTAGFSGDGGAATSATFNNPNDVALDSAGNLYVADSGNNRVRKIDKNGIITTVAGGLNSAGSAGVNTPLAVTVDTLGNVFFSDSGNSEVQEIFPAGTAPFAATAVGASVSKTVTLSNIGNEPLTIASRSSFSLAGNTADFALTGGTCLAGATLAASSGTCSLQIAFTPTAVGARTVTVSIVDDALNSPQSFTLGGTGTAGASTLTWPQPGNIVYGTPLGSAQLDATATTATGVVLAGTFAYSPAAGTILGVGEHSLGVTFTPSDTSYSVATGTVSITVTQATPVVGWTTPASIAYGTPLGATQLDATAVGIAPGALAGTFTYTPPAGTVFAPGSHTLSVVFAPTDTVDYTSAVGSVTLQVTGTTITSLTPAVATISGKNAVITLTGSGFVATSVVQVNRVSVATVYVGPTSLMATIPAADFAQAGTLQITVFNAGIDEVSSPAAFTVIPTLPAITLTGPSTTPSASQPSVGLAITNPYPLDLTATFTLTFSAQAGSTVDDPAIQFAGGGRSFSVVVPANSTVVPAVELQAGTDAGTITVTATLAADGLAVTPGTLVPLVITVPPSAPILTGTTVTRAGNQLTVAIHGYSNTRELSQASFHFAAVNGATLDTADVDAKVPATTLFGTWYSNSESLAYGSSFTYTQIFNTSDAATNVGAVTVILTNSVGASAAQTSQ